METAKTLDFTRLWQFLFYLVNQIKTPIGGKDNYGAKASLKQSEKKNSRDERDNN